MHGLYSSDLMVWFCYDTILIFRNYKDILSQYPIPLWVVSYRYIKEVEDKYFQTDPRGGSVFQNRENNHNAFLLI